MGTVYHCYMSVNSTMRGGYVNELEQCSCRYDSYYIGIPSTLYGTSYRNIITIIWDIELIKEKCLEMMRYSKADPSHGGFY